MMTEGCRGRAAPTTLPAPPPYYIDVPAENLPGGGNPNLTEMDPPPYVNPSSHQTLAQPSAPTPASDEPLSSPPYSEASASPPTYEEAVRENRTNY